ncbi:MAG: hypothetical protein JNL10_13985 [Verrucomicrobiales bacterium]|nr:hypothetical protein [Verrucomicrobiales bacterium]
MNAGSDSSPGSVQSRRDFLSTVAFATGGATLAPAVATRGFAAGARSSSRRPKVALLATEIRKFSHAQHFVDRLLEGYGWAGKHHHPPFEFAGLYVDQFPEGDLTQDRVARHKVKLFPSVEETLTLGGSRLAVDGVLIIAEHGVYPRTEKGQTLYPRNEFFQKTVKVFESSGRSVPVFNDKHLSTDWGECVAMVAASKRLGFPFLAGSSLPVTWRIPSVEIPLGTPMTESVCVCYGGIDSYDIHGLETAQCMSERREGGEPGVRRIQAVRGPKVWSLLGERPTTQRLASAALARSFTFRGPTDYPCAPPDLKWLRKSHRTPTAYFIEHRDGFRTTLLLLSGVVSDFNYAGMTRSGDILSCQMYLPMPAAMSTLADFFNPLTNNIERMILENAAPYPVERTLLTSGMTLRAVESLYRDQSPLDTPELDVTYAAPRQSTYWRT